MGERRGAAVLGAGNGGQGMAAYLVRKGYTVRLWNRADEREEREWLAPIRAASALEVGGWGAGPAPIEVATTDLGEALEGASLIAVVTTADAHRPLAAALGAETIPLQRYLVDSLGAPPGDLYTSIHGCAIYRTVPAPPAVDHRYLWEDVIAGVVPMVSLGRALGCELPLLEATLAFAEALLGRDLMAQGRTVERLGLAGLDAAGIRRRVRGEAS